MKLARPGMAKGQGSRAVRICAAVLALSFFFLPLVPEAAPYRMERAPGRLDFIEKKRRLVLLPLVNATGDAKLDYLREGVMKILADRFKNAGFLWVERPETLLTVAPLPGAGRRSHPPTRLALDVEAARLDQRTFEIVQLGDPRRRAELMGADYLLDGTVLSPGEFSKLRRSETQDLPAVKNINNAGGQVLLLDLSFFDARRGRSTRRLYRLDRRRIYDGMDAVAEDLFGAFLGRPLVKFRVETPRPGAMAFIGDLYLGRTPLEYRLIPGTYELNVSQQGFLPAKRRIRLAAGGGKVFRVENLPEERSASLRVTSDPPGARVFLDYEYIGVTPLARDDLPGGAHRIRVSREGYIDRFVGVELEPGKQKEFELKMKQGDTEQAYLDPHHLVLDWDYDDLSFYFGLNAAAFYASFIHFTIRAERIDDSVVAFVPTLSLLELDQLGLYHFQIIEQKRNEAAIQRSYANASIGGGAFSLVAAIFCLYRGIAVDSREIGEISLHFTERIETTAPTFAAAPTNEPRPHSTIEPRYNLGLDIHF